MKYAHIDSDGILLGWYSPEDDIPTPNVEVSDEVWQQALDINANKYVDGQFVFEDIRTFEVALNDLREERNGLLKETDHFALADLTMTPEMTTYRQALRDITEGLTTAEEVKAVVFPTKPSNGGND